MVTPNVPSGSTPPRPDPEPEGEGGVTNDRPDEGRRDRCPTPFTVLASFRGAPAPSILKRN